MDGDCVPVRVESEWIPVDIGVVEELPAVGHDLTKRQASITLMIDEQRKVSRTREPSGME